MSSNSSCRVRPRRAGGGSGCGGRQHAAVDQAARLGSLAGHDCRESHCVAAVVLAAVAPPSDGRDGGAATEWAALPWHCAGYGHAIRRSLRGLTVVGFGFVEVDAHFAQARHASACHAFPPQWTRSLSPTSLSIALRMEASRSSIFGSIDNSTTPVSASGRIRKQRTPSHYLSNLSWNCHAARC